MAPYLYDCLRQLIAFDTVSSRSNRSAIDFLANRLEGNGFRVAPQLIDLDGVAHANLVAWTGPPCKDGLIISGHVDTVPFEGQPGWTRDPLQLEEHGDRIFGRGTSDMKGFLAQCLDVAARFDRSKLKRPLVFVLTASEEVGCLGAKAVAPELATILGETPVPSLAWIGEPTSNHVKHAHKSIARFDVIVRGRGGHSGAPAQGVNAIAVMGRVIETIGKLQEERRRPNESFRTIFPDAPHDVFNFGTVQGGIALNMIAEECVLRVSYRALPDKDPLDIHREVTRRLAALDPRDYAGGEPRARIEVGTPMLVPPLNSPRGTALEKALFEVFGQRDSGGALFGTDGGWFERSGLVSLICGPGDFDQAHQPNESIDRAAFERGPASIVKVIERLCCV